MKVWKPELATLLSERLSRDDDTVPAEHDAWFVLASFCGASLVVASLLVLVWVRIAEVQQGYRVEELRAELVKLRHERSAFQIERAALLRPERLERLAHDELGLTSPEANRTVNFEAKHAVVDNDDASNIAAPRRNQASPP